MLNRTSARPTRTQATEASYRNTYCDLRHIAERDARAGGDLFEVVAWFCSKHDYWSSSTIRQYRAALRFTVRTTERLHPDRRRFLMMRLRRGPDARHSGPRRTAARKRKSLPYAEWTLLMQTVRNSPSPDGRLLLCFLIFGPALFLRPSEYLAARVEGNVLVVRNGKATNGRANGEERSRDLDMPASVIDELATFLALLAEAAQTAGSPERLFDRLSARLARVCKRCGVRRVSLYTLRHVGIATAKAWMTPAEVAAAAGHASTRTASAHYAKRRHGWGDVRLAGLPTAASIQAVRQVGNPRFDQRLPPKAAPSLPH
jgi:integrase